MVNYTHFEKVRALDINAGNHLSNDKLLSYFTECNDCFFRDLGFKLDDFFNSTCVISQVNIKFIKEIKYPNQIKIDLSIDDISRLKIIFSYKCYDQDGQLSHTANITCVLVSNVNHKVVKITDEMKSSLKKVS